MDDDWLSTQELFTKARALAKLACCACAAALERCARPAALQLTSAREHPYSCWKARQTCLSLATVRVAEGRDLAGARTLPTQALTPRRCALACAGNLVEYESASVRATLGRSIIGCACLRCVRVLAENVSRHARRSDINFSTLTHPDDVEHIGKRALRPEMQPPPHPVPVRASLTNRLRRRQVFHRRDDGYRPAGALQDGDARAHKQWRIYLGGVLLLLQRHALLCHLARHQQRQEGATLHARLPEHHFARCAHASEQHQGARLNLRASVLAPLTGLSMQVACELLGHSSTFVPTPDAKELLTAVAASTRVLLAIVQNVMLKKRLDIDGACA